MEKGTDMHKALDLIRDHAQLIIVGTFGEELGFEQNKRSEYSSGSDERIIFSLYYHGNLPEMQVQDETVIIRLQSVIGRHLFNNRYW